MTKDSPPGCPGASGWKEGLPGERSYHPGPGEDPAPEAGGPLRPCPGGFSGSPREPVGSAGGSGRKTISYLLPIAFA